MAVIVTVLGAAAFVVTHLVIVLVWRWLDGANPPWFLNAGPAVAFTAVCFLIIGAVVGATGGRAALRRGVLTGSGATLAAATVLAWIGPGTLYPIAVAIAGCVLIASSTAGAMAGRLLAPRDGRSAGL